MRAETDRRGAAGYARPQVALHWLVVLLVAAQWVTAGGMEDFFERFKDSAPPGFPDATVAALHAGGGASVLVLMLLRIAARLRWGAPDLPADMSPLLKGVAHLNHYGLYAALLLLPLTGVAALFLTTEAGDLHELLKTLLLLLILAHLGGAAFHAVVRRDGVIWRMLSWRRTD